MPHTEYHHAEPAGLELVLSRNAGRLYPWHIHAAHWTVGFVLAGTAILGARDAPSRSLPAGSGFVVRPCQAHCLTVAPQSELAVLCLDASRITGQFAGNLTAAVSAALPALKPLCPPTAAIAARVLARPQSFAPAPAHASDEADASPVRTVARRIMQTPEIPFSVAEMAEQAGYSQWHFLRCFQKETGLTPHALQLVCRLSRARALLRKDTATAEAAVSAGFADQSHLHKVFKFHHGLTPRQFLRASFLMPARL